LEHRDAHCQRGEGRRLPTSVFGEEHGEIRLDRQVQLLEAAKIFELQAVESEYDCALRQFVRSVGGGANPNG
jgi:hypothetical protein